MKQRSGFSVMLHLVGLVKPLLGYMVLAITMGLIGHLCASFITVIGTASALNVLGFERELSLSLMFFLMGLFALIRGLLRYAEQACNHFIAFKLLALIRNKVFAALRKLCPAKLEGRDRGDLISVITSDIELLEVFYAHTISPVCIAVLFSAVMCLYIGSVYPVLGGIALAAYVIVGAIVPLITSRRSGDLGLRLRGQSGDLSSFVLDSLRGLDEIMQYEQGAKRLHEMDARTDELTAVDARMKLVTGQNNAAVNTVILLLDLTMLLTAGYLHHTGAVGFDGVVLSVAALMSSFGPVVALANLGSTLQNTFAAGDRVLDILEETPVTQELSGFEEVSFSGASVEGVTFAYGDETILKDVSLTLPTDTIVGIVGRSGSGKSTLLRLLMRFWEPQQGRVCLSGVDVNQINTANLRDMESFVTQQTHLFRDTIRNNLRVAKPDATDAEIEHACRQASVHDFILSLPNGYDTQVGELGDTLSGGERQRLGLARAFLHDAPLMLLDEPTSNLDSLNEAVILQALRREREHKTIVLVSHRASTMGIADMVYTVENGRMS